jgi:transcriptional regulator
MYIPKSFSETDLARLHSLMQAYNFATVVTTQADGVPLASHVPLLIDTTRGAYGTLIGHLARANDQWKAMSSQEVLVIFQGPHAYVSPSWYQEHPSVPTWDYAVVHAYGKPRVIQDAGELEIMLRDLVQTHEARFENPWSITQAQDFVHKRLPAVVGFEIEITRLEGKFKLSQNRSEEDQQLVIQKLQQLHEPLATEVAQMLEQNLTKTQESR